MNPTHRDHDELLIVRAGSDELDAVDGPLADRQLAACGDCRALLADIRAIRAATVASVLRVPPRPRSFRIPADELERASAPPWRRWVASLGTPRFDLLRPMATAVAGLGLVVMVLGNGLPFGAPVSMEFAKSEATPPAALGAPTPAPTTSRQDSSVHPPTESPAATAAPGEMSGNGAATPAPSSYQPAAGPGGPSAPTDLASPAGIPPTLLGGLIAIAGAAILLFHTAARRLAGR